MLNSSIRISALQLYNTLQYFFYKQALKISMIFLYLRYPMLANSQTNSNYLSLIPLKKLISLNALIHSFEKHFVIIVFNTYQPHIT